MKTIKLLFIFLISIYNASADNLQTFTSVSINFKGLVAKDSIIIAYADQGSILKSKDNSKSWEQYRVFHICDLINVIIEKNRLVAFSVDGQIAISSDLGESWQNQNSINDSVSSVTEFSDGYFCSVKSGIIKLNKNFEIVKSIQIQNTSFDYFDVKYGSESGQIQSLKNLLILKDKIIFTNDSTSTIDLFDLNLNPLETINLKTYFPDKNYRTNNLCSDSNSLYIYINDTLYKTSDFKTYESIFSMKSNEIFDNTGYPYIYKIYKNKIYCITKYFIYNPQSGPYLNLYEIKGKNEAIKLASINTSVLIKPETLNQLMPWNDFNINNGIFTFITDYKYLHSYDLEKHKDKRICERMKYISTTPIAVSDSTIIVRTTDKQILKSNNSGKTFTRELGDSVFYSLNYTPYYQKEWYFPYYKKFISCVYVLDSIRTNFLVSDDECKTFKKFKVPNIDLTITNSFLQFSNSQYIFIQNSNYKNILRSITNVFDENFNHIYTLKDSMYNINYVYTNENENTIQLIENSDTTMDLRYKSKNLTNWNLLKKYDFYIDTLYNDDGSIWQIIKSKKIRYWKEINYKDTSFLVITSFDNKRQEFLIELLNLNDLSIKKIYNKTVGYPNHNIDYSNDTIYLLLNGSIYSYSLKEEKMKLRYALPYLGQASSGSLRKFGNYFWLNYHDSLRPYNKYVINPLYLDTIYSGVNEEIEVERSYLFTYPPFPIPAKNQVSSLIYWDINSDIAIEGIYDINGQKVENEDQIFLDRINQFSGYINWKFNTVKSGVYFIKLKHGSETKAIKVIVE